MFAACIMNATGGMDNNGMNACINIFSMTFRLVPPLSMEFMYGKQQTQNVDSQRVVKFMINETQEESLLVSRSVPDDTLPETPRDRAVRDVGQ